MINYNFLIDTQGERSVHTDAVFTSGDVRGYRMNFSFKENGKALGLDGLNLVIKAKRADGAVISDKGVIDGMCAFYDVKSSVYRIEGEVSFEVALVGSDGMYVTTKEIIANVREGFGEADVLAEDKTPVLSAIISESAVASAKADEAKKVAEDGIKELKESVDAALNEESENPVQNKAIHAAIMELTNQKVSHEEFLPYQEQVKKNTNNNFANALKGSSTGAIVSIDDVSAVEHDVSVKVSSKNIIPYPYYQSTKTLYGITYTVNGDGSITVNGTATSFTIFEITRVSNEADISDLFEDGATYRMSGAKYPMKFALCYKEKATNKDAYWYSGDTFTVNKSLYTYNWIRIQAETGATVDNVTIYPMIEKGTVATVYTPYVPDLSTATLKTFGKNLIDVSDKSKWVYRSCTYSDGVLTCNIPAGNQYAEIYTTSLSLAKVLLQNRGKSITYSLAETLQDRSMAIVIYGKTIEGKNVTIAPHKGNTNNISTIIREDLASISQVALRFNWKSDSTFTDTTTTVSNIQLEIGEVATDYGPYIEPVSYTVAEDGTAEGVKSIYPNMTIATDTLGVLVECNYNKDANKVIEKLTNAIISLGGMV